jgi:hypothetical protein
MNLPKNWRTTLAGVVTILTVINKFVNAPEAVNEADYALVATAIGLLTAKDSNVTGGTVQQ